MIPGASVVPCLRCDTPFERLRASGRYCPGCRAIRRSEARDRKNAERLTRRDDARSLIDSYVMGGMDHDYVERVISPRIDDYLDSVGDFEGDTWGVVPDQQPDGTLSPYGSEDGRTSEFTDIAAMLDELGEQAAAHRWFLDNPHWNADLTES